MTQTQEIAWKRIGIETAAIVASILLAFAIDAWWDARKETANHSVQLQSLVREFEEAQRHLNGQLEGLESSLAGTINILELMGPNATEQESQLLPTALIGSFDVGISPPQQGVLRSILTSRGSLGIDRAELWSALQSWSRMMDNLAVDGNHLEQNREQDFIAALIRLQVSMSSIIRPRFTRSRMGYSNPPPPPASKFDADWSTLLRDPGIETVFTMRALRTRLLLIAHEDAIQIATEIIAQLERER